MDLRLISLSIEQREINLDNRFTRTESSEDIACSSNFSLLPLSFLNKWPKLAEKQGYFIIIKDFIGMTQLQDCLR